MTPAEALATALRAALGGDFPPRLGVAVSGGSDSMALLRLLADWARGHGIAVHVATVDHGLRPEAADEARLVQARSAELGLSHDTLHWTGGMRGNVQAAARAARYRLLADWATARGIGHVCLGHTADDQAETLLLNLARGSGVDGLAAMPPRRAAGGVVWLRPLLRCRRAALRDNLRREGATWAEDPGNADPRFDRVRARTLLADPPLPGLTVPRLAATARHMAAARRVLAQAAAEAAARLTTAAAGELLFDAEGLFALPDETRWRLLAAALCAVSCADRRPRFAALERAEALLRDGRRATLHGCLCAPGRGVLRIGREPAALRNAVTGVPGPWDGRWRIDGPSETVDGRPVSVRALGEAGLRQAGLTREATGLPRDTLAALPGIWDGAALLAAPAATGAGLWTATPLLDLPAFIGRLLSD